MAVIVKYVVERDGEEKMTFTSKKDADAYDKMLDIADGLSDFIHSSTVEIDDRLTEELSLYLAQHSGVLQQLLKGGKLKVTSEVDDRDAEEVVKPAKKTTTKKAA